MPPPEASPATTQVVVRRSARRRRTVAARREGNTIVVMIPDTFDAGEERKWVQQAMQRLAHDNAHERDTAWLSERADHLNKTYFGGALRISSVSWSPTQRRVWGTCRPDTASIRLSSRLRQQPLWVLDYVLCHELAHLIEPTHNAHFWRLVGAYPHTDRARGYLEGLAAAHPDSI